MFEFGPTQVSVSGPVNRHSPNDWLWRRGISSPRPAALSGSRRGRRRGAAPIPAATRGFRRAGRRQRPLAGNIRAGLAFRRTRAVRPTLDIEITEPGPAVLALERA